MLLEQLYKGNIRPADLPPIESPQRDAIQREIELLEEQLENKLDAEGRRLLTRLGETKNMYEAIVDFDIFIKGFRMGSLIMVEVFHEWESLLFDKDLLYHNKRIMTHQDFEDEYKQLKDALGPQ